MNLEPSLIQSLIGVAWKAGDEILAVYESDEFDVEAKGDGSPLTRADRRAHDAIVSELSSLCPDIPVLSEESGEEAMEARSGWSTFWLVDPLDGTKEFIKRNGEFTVNVALIVDRAPAWGVVLAPVLKTGYAGGLNHGAFRFDRQDNREAIHVRAYHRGPATVVASRSHRGEAVDAFLESLAQRQQPAEVRSMGSSLKLCLVAEGAADVYPRLGPTCEWDTAAAHAVVEGAGGSVTDLAGRPLRYNKASILNPWFLVSGAGGFPWTELVPPVPTDPSAHP